ncbi:MAG: EthD family reductase [Pseudonocardia sp.]
MYQVTVLYNHPEDAAAFDKHYREVHIPLAKKMPGLNGYYVNWCEPAPDGAKPPFHLIATLTAESKDAALAALGSPEGQAAVADLPNFATGGVQLSFGEVDSAL